MPSINMSSITGKLNEYRKSDECKKRISRTIDDYVKNGVKRTAAGSYVLTVERMNDIAGDLIYTLRQIAGRYKDSQDIPDDILSLFDELYSSEPRNIGGSRYIKDANYYAVDIVFDTDLYRPSLEPMRWKGVDNIIKLFNEGYSTGSFPIKTIRTVNGNTVYGYKQKQVHGYWEKADKVVWSVPYRRHLGFMEEAIDEFNKKYEGVAKAELLW